MFTSRLRVANVVLAAGVAAFVASGVSYGAPPKPLNAEVCKGISGAWTPKTCTIPENTSGVVSSGVKINKGDTLDIKGSLTVNPGVTIDNDGTIIVENVAGVSTPFDDSVWGAGLLVLGTLDNSGGITIKNETANTEGITVSVSVSQNDPSDPNPFIVVPGTLTNSGTITVQNRYQTRGIKNLGTLANSATGTITVANSLTTSVGIYNRRDNHLDSKYYVSGAMTNAGRITISNSGDSSGNGIYSGGLFTNSATGTFTINPSAASDDAAIGFYNKGSFTNYGTFTNNRGSFNEVNPPTSTWGSFNELGGTMINYGTTYAGTTPDRTGTFYNDAIMINLGKITSYGVLVDLTENESPLGSTMINFGTLYNYGAIYGGTNKGICIDEPGAPGGC